MRVDLGGRGVPRGEFALIGIGESTGVPVVVLLEDGEVFTPADYISLGYTHVEIWCVGAVGGRGGDATETIQWRFSTTKEVMPDWAWEEVLKSADAMNGPNYRYILWWPPDKPVPGPYEYHDSHGAGGTGGSYILTPRQLAHWQNPTHEETIYHWLEPYVNPGGPYIGGGGGGGGLHVVASRLDTLPGPLVAEVGQKGADGAPGQAKTAAAYNPAPFWIPTYSSWQTESEARWNWRNRFPNGKPLVGGPQAGLPGGASSLGDICRASGGEGGKAAIHWPNNVRTLLAHGGAGGRGDRLAPGGGAAGSLVSHLPGKDGGWDGTIGEGGGGGRGGAVSTGGSTIPRTLGVAAGSLTGSAPSYIEATEGGRGSLNYADTSVYGARGPKGTYTGMMANMSPVFDPATGMTYYVPNGTFTEKVIESRINPGSGGGARIPGQRKYGSRAVGYDKNGAVLVRVTKIE